ncbi:MAG: serine hydrolase domain-containing protein [Phenylobacterium sp.]
MKAAHRILLAGVLALGLASASQAEVKLASPQSVGFGPQGLSALDAGLHGLVDEGKLAGVTTLVARHGKVVHIDAYGVQDLDSKVAVAPDTIWRIASMTKPVTGVAMMILWEEGRWKLDDPVSKYIPEFADLKVKGPGGTLVAQVHPMTMRELMSHTAGFDVSAGYDAVKLGETDLQGMVDKLAKLPLASQPGTDWAYGPSVNIQGYIVEKLSGQSLDRFFQTRIFDPLKMVDTQFWVDPSKAARVSRIHTYAAGKLVGGPTGVVTAKPRFLAGSGGLYSTTEDYWRFSQMLLNGGQLDGARILKPATVVLMRKNVLNPGVLLDLYGPTQPGIGFGLDFAVLLDPAAAKSPQGLDSFYWGGAFGTWFWIDPTNDLVFVGMIQNLAGSVPGGGTPEVRAFSQKLVYDALTDRKK